MSDDLITKSTITINAPTAKVWDALTNPDLIKQYLFGTDVISDWKVGSPVTYKGVWQGKEYKDKGVILKVEPEKLLESTYWSSMSGLADLPQNYKKVTYELSPNGNQTILTITNDNNKTEEEKDHAQKNWDTVLATLKGLLEK